MSKEYSYKNQLFGSKGKCIQHLIDTEGRTFKVVLVPNKAYNATVKEYRLFNVEDDQFLPCTKYQAKKHLSTEQLRIDALHEQVKSLMNKKDKSFGQYIEDAKTLNKLASEDVAIQTMQECILKVGYTEFI